jgi:D-alanyl-D-alanine carboxypeptidase (penicillin-binding protein 5/6)
MGMHMFAIVGLISFGVMAVPIFTVHHYPLTYATEEVAPAPVPSAYAGVAVKAEAALVYDLTTNTVLYEHNSTKQLPLASLTKLLTLYATASTLSPDKVVAISESALAQEGESGFTLGESFRIRDLELLALVASSNDAAQALSEASAKEQQVSSESLLASAASAAGLTETYAHNGTGLDINERVSGGYGSALDIAHLAGKILTLTPDVAQATIEPSVTVTSLKGVKHTLRNTNQDIGHLPNPLLSKTGLTDLAGGNLVVVFDAGVNHPVAVVVLGSTKDGRFEDVEHLVSRTLDHFAPAKK